MTLYGKSTYHENEQIDRKYDDDDERRKETAVRQSAMN